jgi:hypothetical protein
MLLQVRELSASSLTVESAVVLIFIAISPLYDALWSEELVSELFREMQFSRCELLL